MSDRPIRTVECSSVEALTRFFEALPPGSLFRGQTREYPRADGGPDLRTTFARLGCVPERMIKWWHYSRTILARHVKAFEGLSDLPTDQAILQHYGWRSFFLDATSDATVACWFAGHQYSSRRALDLIEDCIEDPVFVVREQAHYTAATGTGCVYVLSRKALRARNVQAVDLIEVTTAQGQPRYVTQSAFMIGPLEDHLPDDCILARVHAPSVVFCELAARAPGMVQEHLFPGPENDPVLATLLSVPWVKRYDADGGLEQLDFFERGLPLPEYSVRPIRRTIPSNAYFRRFWIANARIETTHLARATFYLTSESLYHGVAPVRRFPRISALLRRQQAMVVEIEGLVRHPYDICSRQYGKGIYLEQNQDGLILVTELAVDHPGGRPAGFGITRGHYFRPEADGRWTRIQQAEQCDCGHDALHDHHLVVAAHFEALLEEGAFRRIRPGVLATADVNPATDPAVREFAEDDLSGA